MEADSEKPLISPNVSLNTSPTKKPAYNEVFYESAEHEFAATRNYGATSTFGADGVERRLNYYVFLFVVGMCMVIALAAVIVASRDVQQLSSLRSTVDFPSSFPPTKVGSIALHLLPGTDPLLGIMDAVLLYNLKSAWVSTAVGSLTNYSIRFANQNTVATGFGHFEIVSLVGTLSANNISVADGGSNSRVGSWHLHISIADGTGATISGHLAVGSSIYTTLEVVVMYDCAKEFYRKIDGTSGYDELQIRTLNWC